MRNNIKRFRYNFGYMHKLYVGFIGTLYNYFIDLIIYVSIKIMAGPRTYEIA